MPWSIFDIFVGSDSVGLNCQLLRANNMLGGKLRIVGALHFGMYLIYGNLILMFVELVEYLNFPGTELSNFGSK